MHRSFLRHPARYRVQTQDIGMSSGSSTPAPSSSMDARSTRAGGRSSSWPRSFHVSSFNHISCVKGQDREVEQPECAETRTFFIEELDQLLKQVSRSEDDLQHQEPAFGVRESGSWCIDEHLQTCQQLDDPFRAREAKLLQDLRHDCCRPGLGRVPSCPTVTPSSTESAKLSHGTFCRSSVDRDGLAIRDRSTAYLARLIAK